MKRPLVCFCLLAAVALGHPQASQAAGQRLSSIVKSRYFTVYGYKDLDLATLLGKMNFNTSLQVDSLGSPKMNDLKDTLARTFDALFGEVSDILNINVTSFHVQIKIYEDDAGVKAAYADLFRNDFKDNAFYDHQHQTIYLSFADLSLEDVGYQIAQAVIAQYFVVQPPPEITEVLAGFVEFNLKKHAQVVKPR